MWRGCLKLFVHFLYGTLIAYRLCHSLVFSFLELTSVLFRANEQKHKDCNDQKQNRQPSHKSRHCTSVSCNYFDKLKVIFLFTISQFVSYVSPSLPWMLLPCPGLLCIVSRWSHPSHQSFLRLDTQRMSVGTLGPGTFHVDRVRTSSLEFVAHRRHKELNEFHV